MGSTKGIYLVPDRTASVWRVRPLFHSCFPVFSWSSSVLPCKLILLPLPWREKVLGCWRGVGSPLHSSLETPCMWHMQTMTCLLSLVECIFSTWHGATLFHPPFFWVQPYSLADPIEISEPSCEVSSCCLVYVKLLWWEPQRWTHKQDLQTASKRAQLHYLFGEPILRYWILFPGCHLWLQILFSNMLVKLI